MSDYNLAMQALENVELGEWMEVFPEKIGNFRKYLWEICKKQFPNKHIISRHNKKGTFVYLCSDQKPINIKKL